MGLLDNELFQKDGTILPLAFRIEFKDILPKAKEDLFLKVP